MPMSDAYPAQTGTAGGVFQESASVYDAIYQRAKDYPAEVAKLLTIRSSGRLLDVACGTGAHLAYLREHFEVEGLDLSPAQLTHAAQRLPGVPLHIGDMCAFDLGRRFDMVTCLSASIGYAADEAALRQAVATMAGHVAVGGQLVIEPWFTPDAWWTGHVAMTVVDDPDIKIARIAVNGRVGDVSVIDLHHLVGTAAGVRTFVERHEMCLFDRSQIEGAMKACGLRIDYDDVGLTGKGLYIGHADG